jgi:hypothetical protein
MATRVTLSDIIDGLESQSDRLNSYLNKETGEIVTLSEDDFILAESDDPLDDLSEWEQESIETIREIEDTDKYVALPTQFDIDEYDIMERFCRSIEDDEIRDQMYQAIEGRGAFRYFKDSIHRLKIAEDWYKFRDEAFREIAVEWCEENGIEYVEE